VQTELGAKERKSLYVKFMRLRKGIPGRRKDIVMEETKNALEPYMRMYEIK
jgi:hypothetical protein